MLHEAELYRVRMPLEQPFRTTHGTTNTKEALLVRVVTGAGHGWGECSAFTTPGYAPDTIDSSRLALRDYLLPRAFAGESFDDVSGHQAARAALECALLDAQLRAEGVSLASHLGAERATVPAGVSIGFMQDLGAFRDVVAFFVAAGYRRVKCKITPGRDVDVIFAAFAGIGAWVATEIAADANGSYASGESDALVALEDFNLQCIEQPYPRDDLDAHALLAARMDTRVCLDESITSVAGARHAITIGACDAISIKPARVGGLLEARRIHDECVARGVPALAGGMLETGVGRAALLALAALPGFTLAGDCAASDRYFGPDGDITEPFELDDGHLRVPDQPGIGVDVIPERLARVTVARELLRARDY